jgi:hypothetical protein
MSSLAAARADNFYYPPGFDPDKHGSLNKVRTQSCACRSALQLHDASMQHACSRPTAFVKYSVAGRSAAIVLDPQTVQQHSMQEMPR